MNRMQYGNNPNFMKHHKSVISMEWFLLWATGCLHLGQENNSRRLKRKVSFIKITSYVVGDVSGDSCKKKWLVTT